MRMDGSFDSSLGTGQSEINTCQCACVNVNVNVSVSVSVREAEGEVSERSSNQQHPA